MRLISLLLRGKRKDRKCHWIRVSINFKFIEQLCILQSYGSALDPCELSVTVRERITIATGIPGGYELLGEWKKRQWSGHKECDRGQLREERREIRQGKWRRAERWWKRSRKPDNLSRDQVYKARSLSITRIREKSISTHQKSLEEMVCF